MNPSTTSIDLNVGLPNIAVVSYAVQGDQQARVITAHLYDGSDEWTPPTGAIGIIRFRTPLGTSGIYDTDEDGNTAVTWSGNVATLRIVQNAIAVAGCVPMQLEFYQGSQKLSAFSWMMIVEPSVLTDTEFMQTDYYNLLSQQISALICAIAYPPIINPTTRNWMLWDTETNSYVDSGYSSVGIKGDQGDQGVSITRIQRTSGTGEAGSDDTYTVYLSNGTTAGTFNVHNGSNGTNGTNGLSIGRIEKTSGTGAAGTTDTYTVYLSNNTSVGTFTVYNGADGAGTPGTQLPLMDSDTASAGSANAYSREDHVHPRDSFLKGAIDDLQDIVGDGSLSGFTATDLTGAANELKGSLNTLETDVGGTVAIGTEAGLIRKSCFFRATANIPLGSTGVTLEAYSRGAIFSSDGITGSIVAVGYVGRVYSVFFSSGAIVNAQINQTMSPAFTGTPTAPTAALGTNTTQLATTQFVQSAIVDVSATYAELTIKNAAATIRKVGKIVFLDSPQDFQSLPKGNTLIGTVPAGYRPATYCRVPITNKLDSQLSTYYYVTIFADGRIEVSWGGSAQTSAVNGSFSAVYICS